VFPIEEPSGERNRLDLANSKDMQFVKLKEAYFILTTIALLIVTVVDEGVVTFIGDIHKTSHKIIGFWAWFVPLWAHSNQESNKFLSDLGLFKPW
jgi:hypothetical protein